MTTLDWNEYPNFSEDEFRCSCGCGRADMDPHFMGRLQHVRTMAGFGFPVSSGFRCPEYDELKGGAGVHPFGQAVDLQLSGSRALTVISLAYQFGIPRIGNKQHGPHPKRFIHLDTLIKPGHPTPWLWSYP